MEDRYYSAIPWQSIDKRLTHCHGKSDQSGWELSHQSGWELVHLNKVSLTSDLHVTQPHGAAPFFILEITFAASDFAGYGYKLMDHLERPFFSLRYSCLFEKSLQIWSGYTPMHFLDCQRDSFGHLDYDVIDNPGNKSQLSDTHYKKMTISG